MNKELEKKVIEFLEGLYHGPCGSIDLAAYEKFIRNQAIELLKEIEKQENK